MNKIAKVFNDKKGNLLNVYCTAGFPKLDDTTKVVLSLQESGVDFIEIGMPFSDPMADGETIQKSNHQALENGMSIALLLEQLNSIKDQIKVPIILMGYFNPVIQYGVDRFLQECANVGVAGLIIPDLPLREYLDEYQEKFDAVGIQNIFLVTPQTSAERIAQIDRHSMAFIYVVSTYATTGGALDVDDERKAYFDSLKTMQLRNPYLIGFGIGDKTTFDQACEHAHGAIIGSAFIKAIENSTDLKSDIDKFVKGIRPSN